MVQKRKKPEKLKNQFDVRVGRNIRRLRNDYGRRNEYTTQIMLSNLLGVTRPVISNLEAGNRRLSFQEAEKIATYFSCSLSDLTRQ